MRLSLLRLGSNAPHFGNAGRVHGEYRFALSPDVQKPFKGFFKDAFVNVFKEYVWRSWYYYTPPFVIFYSFYLWNIKEHERMNRKDLYDYIDEE